MENPKLQLFDRKSKPYSNARAALRDGHVPGVMYSKGNQSQPFYVNEADLAKLLSTYGTSRKVEVNFNNEISFAIIKQFQKNSLRGQYLHVDLQPLDENEKVKLVSNIHILHRDAVEQGGKILQVQTHDVEIEMYPRYMPETVEFDAAMLLEKDTITLADLNIAANRDIEILADLDTVVATLVYSQVSDEVIDEANDPVVHGIES
ncbi:hypothetical protein BHU72_13140 [Desulfuribacillus stibiiarsenatis]|uniref:Uncharacterized protein n=1 Tax=Desulfuribacillus stibiiarsenatis TaxID=1390249 RepID=A0A1E5L916_9FIRM|nr:50S ribosomal protein L25 [Desulfuribacillus stibiiarsenatis]OEH86548.1 hypothetical protein BHU72_13140 [Desulfuribacillus stibiiarsenatis]